MYTPHATSTETQDRNKKSKEKTVSETQERKR